MFVCAVARGAGHTQGFGDKAEDAGTTDAGAVVEARYAGFKYALAVEAGVRGDS